jgi:hypothetical protein
MDKKLEAQLWRFSHLLIVISSAQSKIDYETLLDDHSWMHKKIGFLGKLLNIINADSAEERNRKKAEVWASNMYIIFKTICSFDTVGNNLELDVFKNFVKAKSKLSEFFNENISGKFSADVLLESKNNINSISEQDFKAWLPIFSLAFSTYKKRIDQYSLTKGDNEFSQLIYKYMFNKTNMLNIFHERNIKSLRQVVDSSVNSLCERVAKEQKMMDSFNI